MNKKFWLFAALCAGLSFTACTNDDEPQIDKVITDDDWITPDGRVIVQLSGSNPEASTTVTRAPLETLKGASLGIFALAKDNEYDWTKKTDPDYDCLLNNIKATVEKDPEENGNSKIRLYDSYGKETGAVYYYPMNNKYCYNFYGYGPYQEKGSKVETDKATVTFKIDGSQDIIWAKAEAPTVEVYVNENKDVETLNGYQSKYIRKIKYHNELLNDEEKKDKEINHIPVLNFSHQLTQLVFNLIAAEDQSTADKDAAKNLTVKDIKIVEANKEAVMDMVDGKIDFYAITNDKEMTMIADDGDATQFQIKEDQERIGYLMLQPNVTSYQLQLTVMPPTSDNTSTPQQQTVTLTLKIDKDAKTLFEAGKSYKVNIALYAMQEIELEATLQDWKEAPEIILPVE